MSRDGQTIAFDLMGDIYSIPVNGGQATRITNGMAYDVHPRYSPDGKSLAFISVKGGSDNIWTRDLITGKENQVSQEEKHSFFSAEWTPDGEFLVGSRGSCVTKFRYTPETISCKPLYHLPARMKPFIHSTSKQS